MKLVHWKGGGLAGTQYSTCLEVDDVGSLPRPVAGKVAALVDECRFFELPDRLPPGGSSQTDPLEYRLSITDDARAHVVSWDDNSAVPEALQRLVETLSDVDGWVDRPWATWHSDSL